MQSLLESLLDYIMRHHHEPSWNYVLSMRYHHELPLTWVMELRLNHDTPPRNHRGITP